MNIVRKLAISFMAGLMGTLLFGLAWANISSVTIHNRQTVKGWFFRSNFYGQIVNVVLEKAVNSKGVKESNLPINDPSLQSIAKQSFNTVFLQNSVEKVLDNSYNFLDGSTKDLNFSIDLTTPKQQFATGMGTYVSNRVSTLPICPVGQVNSDFNGLSATCRPKTLTAAQAGAITTNRLLSQDFLKDPVFTADKLTKSQENNAVAPIAYDNKLMALRTIYKSSSWLPLILAVTIVILAALIILISSSRRRGIGRVGYVFFSSGALLLFIYIILGYGFTRTASQIAKVNASSPQLTKLLTDMTRVILNDVKGVLRRYIAGYLILGIVAFVLAGLLDKHSKVAEKTIVEAGTKVELSDQLNKDEETSKLDNEKAMSEENKEM